MAEQLRYSVSAEQLAAVHTALAGSKAATNHLIDDAKAKDWKIMQEHWTEIRDEIDMAQDVVYNSYAQPYLVNIPDTFTEHIVKPVEPEIPEDGYPTPEECAEWEAQQQAEVTQEWEKLEREIREKKP